MSKSVAGKELFYDDDVFSFTAMGSKEVISLYFSADTYEDEDGNLFSTYKLETCLLYTSPSPRDATLSRMPSSA